MTASGEASRRLSASSPRSRATTRPAAASASWAGATSRVSSACSPVGSAGGAARVVNQDRPLRLRIRQPPVTRDDDVPVTRTGAAARGIESPDPMRQTLPHVFARLLLVGGALAVHPRRRDSLAFNHCVLHY